MSSNVRRKKKCNPLQKLINIFEDAEYPSVGPHLRLLGFTGLWQPRLKSSLSRFKQMLFYITISFFFSQYIKCIIKIDTDSLKLILQYAPFHLGIVKSCFFKKDYKKWAKLIDYMSFIERTQIAKEDDAIVKDYIKRNRRVTYFFWFLAMLTNLGIFTAPYQNKQINENGTNIYLYIFDGYTPFGKEPPGYYISMGVQTIFGHIMSAYVVGWDTLIVSIMIFFAGQLRMSSLNCKRMITKQARESHQNIAECHRFHTSLIKYQKLFNYLICDVMFVYLIVITVNLGVCIIQIVEIEEDLSTLVSSCVFVMACLIQLLLFYWHSNEVTVESGLVCYSTFQSKWTDVNKKLQKEVLILGLTTNKRLIFIAGPYNEMTLSTFISILRASYSFYTLLKGTN